MITAIPFTIFPLIIYNIIAFAFAGETPDATWAGEIFRLPLMSGERWALTLGDLMIALSIACLFLEIMKSGRTGTAVITNHILSTVVLIIYILEFVIVDIAATSVFFLLTLIALFDVIAGFTITIRTASRDVNYSPNRAAARAVIGQALARSRTPSETAATAEAPAPAAVDAILTAVGEVAYDWSIPDDTIVWGRNAVAVLGVASLNLIATGRDFAALLDPEHPQSRHDAVLNAPTETGGAYRVEYPFHPDRRDVSVRHWIEDLGRWYPGPEGRPLRAHGVIRVINARHEREERLAFLSRHDEVTGSLNRAHLVETLSEALLGKAGKRGKIAFVVAAIDNFETINEVYGFDIGDQIFAAVAQRIKAEIRAGDAIGRFSGGMLGLVLMDCDEDDMHAAALRFHGSVRNEILVTGPGSVAVTISTGGASLPRHGRTAEEAMARAREALHLARQKGHGHFMAYGHSPVRQAQRRANAALSTELVAALQERRLTLAFQPVVDIKTRAPLFHEALVRIDRPGGEAAASDFAAFAERLGLIRLIDRRVLDLAIDVLLRTTRRISINVSADTVGDNEWMARLSSAVAARPALAERLIVEITETAMIKNLEEATTFVGRLHDAGCRVAIDDFGAGYTSFRNLRVLDVDIVKIDGLFIENLPRSPDDQVFVRILTELAQSFGIMTVAEWVQDEETVAILAGFGVDAIQGKLTGSAVSD